MFTKEEIREILHESPLISLFSEREIDNIIEDLFDRYGHGGNSYDYEKIYINQSEIYKEENHA